MKTSTMQRTFWWLAFWSFALVCFGMWAGNAYRDRQAALAQAKDQMEETALLLGQHADRALEAGDKLVQALVELGSAATMNQPAEQARVFEQMRRLIGSSPQISSAWIMDADGKTLVESWEQPPRSTGTYAHRAYFKAHANGLDSLYIGPLQVGGASGRQRFTLSRKITRSDGSFGGVAVAGVFADYFADVYWRAGLGGTGRFRLSSSDGAPLAEWPADVRPMSSDGPATLSAEHALERYPVRIVVSRPYEDVLAPWRARAIGGGLAALAIVAAFGGLTAMGLRTAALERSARNELQIANTTLEGRVRQRTFELQNSEARLSTVLQHLPIGVGVIDESGRFILSNPAMRGYVRDRIPSEDEERYGRWRAFHSDGRRLERSEYPGARALRGETVLPGTEFLYERDDGRAVWTRVAGIPIDGGGKAGASAVVVVQDIDDAKRASAELAARLDELLALYDTAPVGLCMLDAQQRFVRVNKRLAAMNGVPVAEHIGRSFSEVLPGIAPEVDELFRRVIQERAPLLDVEISGQTAAQPGVWRTWNESWVPIFDDQGHFIGINIVAEETTEKKRQEQELRDAHARLKSLLATVEAGTFVWQLPDGAVQGDAGLASLFGMDGPAPEAPPHAPGSYFDRIHPDDLGRAKEKVQAIMSGSSYRYADEYRVVLPSGRIRWCAARGAIDDNLLFSGAVFDVTDLKEAELSLRDSRERAERQAAETAAILSQLSEGVVVTDRDGFITFINRAATQMHGVAHLNVAPSDYSSVYSLFTQEGKKYPAHELPLARAVRGEAATEERWRIRRPDGTEILAIGNARPVFSAGGQPLGAVLTFRDDTDRHSAERALAISERRLNAVLNNTRMAVFMMDARQHCVYMNAAAELLTGFRLEETQGRPLHDVIHHTYPDGRPFPLHECAIDRAFPEDNQTEGEEVFIHRDGSFYPVAFTASPIRDEAAKAVGTIIEVRDIRREKEHEERLQMLIGELNHRVKNTLATVQSIAWQALRGQDVPSHVRDSIESRLIALSRSHDLLTREAWEDAGLADLAVEALDPFGLGEGRAAQFALEGDDVRLRPNVALAVGMALHELATNAVKYGALSTDGGQIRLSWRVGGDRLRICWQERGGPPVSPPGRKGFGSRLLERGLAHELTGNVKLTYAPEGLTCEIDMPANSKGPNI